jgi:hypothetical protein
MSWRRFTAAAALIGAAAAASALVLGGTGRAEASGLPHCVHPQARVAVPPALARFPLPSGTVLDRKQVRYGYAIYSGYVPGAINPARDFFVGRLAAAGFRLGAADSEAAEAEAAYRGHGVHGRWKVRAIYGCAGALTIQIAVR